MGLLDLFSSESKTTNQTTNNQLTKENTLASSDNRVTESGNIGGNVSTGMTGGDVIVRNTDYGALDDANRLSLAALDFGGDSLETMSGVASDALISNEMVSGQALDLGAGAIQEVSDFGRDALGEALGTVEYNSGQAFEFGEQAMASSEAVAADAFGFGEFSLSEALGAMGDSQSMAFGMGGDAIDSIEESNRHTVDTLADQFQFWNQQTTQNVDRSLAFADRANRSEGAAVLESGLKTLMWVGVTIGGTLVLREWAKQ